MNSCFTSSESNNYYISILISFSIHMIEFFLCSLLLFWAFHFCVVFFSVQGDWICHCLQEITFSWPMLVEYSRHFESDCVAVIIVQVIYVSYSHTYILQEFKYVCLEHVFKDIRPSLKSCQAYFHKNCKCTYILWACDL